MNRPVSSKKKQRSKSPSHATPMSAPDSMTAFDVASRFSGRSGFGTPFGNDPSGSNDSFMNLNGRRAPSMFITGPAHPLPGLTHTVYGFKAEGSTYPRICSAYARLVS